MGLRVCGLGFRASGLWVGVWGFGGLGCKVQGLGLGV